MASPVGEVDGDVLDLATEELPGEAREVNLVVGERGLRISRVYDSKKINMKYENVSNQRQLHYVTFLL